MPTKNILLVYEEIPERTVILVLNPTDLAVACLGASEIASIHGTYRNSSDLDEAREAIHDKVSESIFGEWDEGAKEPKPALWRDKIIFRTDDESLCREGLPPGVDESTTVVHTGMVV